MVLKFLLARNENILNIQEKNKPVRVAGSKRNESSI